MSVDYAIIIKNKTRLETLIERFNTSKPLNIVIATKNKALFRFGIIISLMAPTPWVISNSSFKNIPATKIPIPIILLLPAWINLDDTINPMRNSEITPSNTR